MKSEAELQVMKETFNKRIDDLFKLRINTPVKDQHDPNILIRRRLSKISKFYTSANNTINQVLIGSVKQSRDKDRKTKKREILQKLFECEKVKNDLPNVLIGNTVLYEVPLNELYTTLKEHKRMQVFIEKGLHCSVPGCPHVASRLIVTVDYCGNRHFDLFTHDLVHINVDHIEARSKGGLNHIINMQPMCAPHNVLKGSK